MDDKELYQQKAQAQLDEWKAELDRLKAQAANAGTDAQLDVNKQVQELEGKIEEGEAKLAEIAEASDEAWDSIKDGIDSAWHSIRTAFSDAANKFSK